jgi:DNA-directed RNA polymerase subunit beta
LNGKELYSFRIIPDRGSWVELQFDVQDLLYVYLDRRKRRRKFLATTFLRALGHSSDEAVLKLFYKIEKLKLSEKLERKTSRRRCSAPMCATGRSPWRALSSR